MAGVGTPAAYAYNGSLTTTTTTTLYTGPSNGAIVQHIVAVNTTGSAVTLTLYVTRAKSGAVEYLTVTPDSPGTPGTNTLSVPANSAVELVYDVFEANEGLTLDVGDLLQGGASAATSITLTAF